MMEQLPEGKSIGWMQAPPQRIFTHTIRFIGVVRIVIQDGEGFMLIDKGKILSYYFKHGRIELRGNAALDYFNSNPNVEFNLCKYTPEEMAEAMHILNISEAGTPVEGVRPAEVHHAQPLPETAGAPGEPAPQQPKPETPAPVVVKSRTAQPAGAAPAAPGQKEPRPAEEAQASVPAPGPAPAEAPGHDEEFLYERTPAETENEEPAAITTATHEVPAAHQTVPPPAFLEDPDIKIIGQIKKLNGIVAISVFNEERNIMLMGDVEIEPLLKIARSMLETTRKVSPLIDWGQFIHMTLQIPEGNVIIAPYRENYLCLLTTRTINIGHIRRILRDLIQTEGNPG